ncbi:MAG: hypothetical protein B0D92_02075 [Spirochaeta sp. LUC14_002_19_P3]|nr:MAG: hypothetical protein B0D92_02075 [Spirochaeta sp. LUC14_002_19_P3]
MYKTNCVSSGNSLLCAALIFTGYANTAENPLTVTEIAKQARTDVRDSYVLFRISHETDLTDYHLAVVKSVDTAPTAGALKCNIDPTAYGWVPSV